MNESKATEMIDLLCASGKANVDIQDKDGFTPLHSAIQRGKLDVAKKLLEFKSASSLSIENNQNWHALNLAIQEGNLAMVRLLLENGADPNLKSTTGYSPLQQAILSKSNHADNSDDRTQIINLLLDKGADPQLVNSIGNLLIMDAIQQEEKIAEILIKHSRVNVNYANKKGDTPLMLAIQLNKLNIAQLLLDAGADINALNRDKQSMLSIAISRKLPKETIAFLLKNNIDPNTKDKDGTAPIHFAIKNNDLELFSMLLTSDKLDKELKPNSPNITNICYSLSQENYQMVELLLQKGAKWDCEYSTYPTLVHYAVSDNDPKLWELLIKYKADLNAQDKGGNTPMHYACKFGNIDAAKMLLEKGVTPDTKDNFGRRPIDMASYKGYFDIVQLLKTGESTASSKPKGPSYTNSEEAMKAFTEQKTALEAEFKAIGKKLDTVLENIKSGKFQENENTLADMSKFFSNSVDTLENFLNQECMQPANKQQVQATIDKLNQTREQMITLGGLAVFAAEKSGPTKTEFIAKIISEENPDMLYKYCLLVIRKQALAPLKFLIEYKKVPVDTLERGTNETLLHRATPRQGNGSIDVFKYLLEKGIDPLAKNSEGKTVRDIIREEDGDNKVVVRILEKYIQKKGGK